MNVCPRCGAENDPRNQYCSSCGSLLLQKQNLNHPRQRPYQPQSKPANYPYPAQRVPQGRPQIPPQYRPQAQDQYDQNYQDNLDGYDSPREQGKAKRSKLSFIALIIGSLAAVFLISTASSSMSSTTNEWEALGASIAMSMVMPAIILVVTAAILNLIGWLTSNRVVTLISAICYLLGLLAFPMWGFVGIPSMILQFIAFSKMPKK